MNKKLINILVLIFTIILFLIIAEILTRLLVIYPKNESGWHIVSENQILNYEPTPNKEGIFYGYPAYINGYGRRDNHNSEYFPGKEVVAFVGDSMVFGRGVSQNDTLSNQFEEICNSNYNKNIVALNFGVIAYNLEQEVEMIKYKVLEYNVSKIIVVYYLNDLRQKENILFENQNSINLPVHLKIYNFIVLHSRFAFYLKSKLSAIAYNKSYLTYYENLYSNDSYWIPFKNNLSELSQIKKENKIPIYYVIYPHMVMLNDKHPYTEIYDTVIKQSDEYGLDTINLFDVLNGSSAGDLRANIYDSHPNKKANELVAQYLCEKLYQENIFK